MLVEHDNTPQPRQLKAFLTLSLFLWGVLFNASFILADEGKIKIGLLHSLSGTLAMSEKPLIDMAKMAIAEINNNGGLLGKKIEPIIVNGKSDSDEFVKQAEYLIKKQKVSAIFGCWSSACRKAIRPIIEKHQNLLFYPVQYEGLEQSPNIIYSGAAPNQQIIPGVNWALNNLGKRFYLMGSKYIFPYAANQIIKDITLTHKVRIIRERYLDLGSSAVAEFVTEIKQLKPDVIFNTINGSSNEAFFTALKDAGLTNIPIISFSISESELKVIKSAQRDNHYTVWNYFQSIENDVNTQFIKRFKQIYGEERVIGDPMEATYINIHLWALAVKEANSDNPEKVNKGLKMQSFNAPEGVVSFDAKTRHLWKTVRIARAKDNGQFEIVWQSEKPVRAHPFPSYRSKAEWERLLRNFVKGEISQ